ncbi:hypothetical protein SEUCBS140593_010443 [Sporothrix eucalyptigena]|uniref:Uncharacterized protein n=1 Tax=Sporothrix eucalyptigena TaxID=1812306 RepID=A0ABP0D2Z0_9PEZI
MLCFSPFADKPQESHKPQEWPWSHDWQDDNTLELWTPNAQEPDQSCAYWPWDEAFDLDADLVIDVLSPPTIPTSASRSDSSTSSQSQDLEDAYDLEPFFELGDELATHRAEAYEFPLSERDLQSFFDSPQTAVCDNEPCRSPSPQMQHSDDFLPSGSDDDNHDDDVMVPDSRPVQKRQRERQPEEEGPRKRRLSRKANTRASQGAFTRWNHVYLCLSEVGYHLENGEDEAFYWNRHQNSWVWRGGSDLADASEFDLFDPRFYITVRPDGDGFPIEVSWVEDESVFAGTDEINEKTLCLSVDLIWNLIYEHKSQYLD